MLLMYLFIKYIKRGYIISFYNINIAAFIITFFIASIYQFDDKAWEALAYSSAQPFLEQLNVCLKINLVGFFVFILTYTFSEFKNYKRSNNIIFNLSDNVEIRIVNIIFYASIFIWFILIYYVKTIPLFGNRGVFNESSFDNIRPIYLAMNEIISICTKMYMLNFVKNRNMLFKLGIGIFVLLLTGNRGPVIEVLLIGLVYYSYCKYGKRKANSKMLIGIVALSIIGLSLQFVRSNSEVNFNKIIYELFYGNTFSDVRDGAYVLFGWHYTFGTYIFGKNYVADLISFLPSSINTYRQVWSWGSFSTDTLFGMKGHYGLRGGWFLEPYINFGYIGVIISAFIYAKFMAYLENMFYNEIFIIKNNKYYILLLISSLISIFFSSILVSSSFHDIYVLLFMYAVVFVMSKFYRKLKIIKSGIK